MNDFKEKVRQNPDSFDDMDSRPGPSKYPEANREGATPDHIKKLLAERAAKKERPEAAE